MNIIITGSIAYDYLMTFPGQFKDHILPQKLESLSLSFLVDDLTRQRGGVAPNIAYTMALLGERPKVMATVGEDFGEYRAWLDSKGVDTTLIKRVPGVFTASFFATTDRINAQIASFYPGAMAHAAELRFADLPEKPDLAVISPNDPAAMRAYVQECHALGIPYLYDPSQQVVRVDSEVLREGIAGCQLLVVNDYEHGMIEKKTGMALEEVLDEVETLIVTRGEKGATIYSEGRVVEIPVVPPQRILDPTGVGDAFRGGLLTGMARGWDWDLSGKVGALAATYCLEQVGTQNHGYSPPQFVDRFRQHFDDGGMLDALIHAG